MNNKPASDEESFEVTSYLFTRNPIYKPFRYPWAFDAWLSQQRMHWLPEEVSMAEDIKDWKFRLTPAEKNLLTQIFRFFTQGDIEVNNCYMQYYSRIFQPIEIKMMLASFSNMETIHTHGYSYLLETVGMPEIEYQAFLEYKAMKDKWEYMQNFGGDSPQDVALTLALFGGFTEGLQLFGSFAILMNFPRFNKMKGMGQIITWSVRDEELHTDNILRLFRTVVAEHPSIWTAGFRQNITMTCEEVIRHEDAFIDLVFEMGDVEGLKAYQVKEYVRYIANRRLVQMNLNTLYDMPTNPLPWMDDMISSQEHTNFFENRATEYAKASTQGTWDEAFS